LTSLTGLQILGIVPRSLLDSATIGLLRLVMEQRGRIAATLERHGLRLGQELLLAQLWRSDGLTQTQLADGAGVSRAAVTKAVRGLEEAGFVYRNPGDDDARTLRVWLTDAGQRLEGPVTAEWYAIERALWAPLTAAQREALANLADRRH
jgi:DNA-binding MarR family transcriptional regulator